MQSSTKVVSRLKTSLLEHLKTAPNLRSEACIHEEDSGDVMVKVISAIMGGDNPAELKKEELEYAEEIVTCGRCLNRLIERLLNRIVRGDEESGGITLAAEIDAAEALLRILFTKDT